MVYEKDKLDFKILDFSNYKLIKNLQQDIYIRNWNEDEIGHLLKKGGGHGLILYLSKKPIGYCFFRNLVDEAENADKIIVLNHGQILFLGEPNKLKEKTKTKSLSDAYFKITEKKNENL